MHRVDLDTVNAGILQELGGLGKGVHHLVDLLHGQRAGLALGIPAVGGGGGGGGDVVHVQEGLAHGAEGLVLEHLDHDLVDGHGTAHTGGQLNKQLGTGLVELRQPLGQVLEHLLFWYSQRPPMVSRTHCIPGSTRPTLFWARFRMW